MSKQTPKIRPYQSRNLTSWIRAALNFPETVIPSALKTEEDANGIFSPITPILDAYQGGIGLLQQFSISQVVTVGQAVALSNLPQAVSTAYGYLLCALSCSTSAAVARNPVLGFFPTAGYSDDISLQIISPSCVSGSQARWVNFSPSLQPLWCPPGFVPLFYANDLVGVEIFSIKATAFVIPAGFKPT